MKMHELIKIARRRIAAKLPEDEPDCVPDWVCELLITLGIEACHDIHILEMKEKWLVFSDKRI